LRIGPSEVIAPIGAGGPASARLISARARGLLDSAFNGRDMRLTDVYGTLIPQIVNA
jgi:hypothetical protein